MIRVSAARTVGLAAMLAALSGPVAYAQNSTPATTPEGMELLNQTRSRIVYAMPGATLDQYTKVALLECYVAFEKDWQRDYNRDASFQRRISTEDMERIRKELAAEFLDVFSEVLTEAGHEIVDYAGDDVLIVRPAIINLEITSPDTNPADFGRVVVSSAGQMTLYMELFDSTTGAIIARAMDAQDADRGGGIPFEANRVTNRTEARRVIRSWANELAGRLGEVRDATARDD